VRVSLGLGFDLVASAQTADKNQVETSNDFNARIWLLQQSTKLNNECLVASSLCQQWG
jgi:hypothetical protein